jgi:hypothetical protein
MAHQTSPRPPIFLAGSATNRDLSDYFDLLLARRPLEPTYTWGKTVFHLRQRTPTEEAARLVMAGSTSPT